MGMGVGMPLLAHGCDDAESHDLRAGGLQGGEGWAGDPFEPDDDTP